MPAGDIRRIWFPELVEMLRSRWHAAMDPDEMVRLTQELDDLLQRVRSAKNIKPPMMWCPNCQARHPAQLRVSVRAAVFALQRFGIADADTIKALDKRWTKYRQQHHLDGYGAPRTSEASLRHLHNVSSTGPCSTSS